MEQIFGNLIGNGLKFNRSQASSRRRSAVKEVAGGMATFYVRDNGIGIEPEYHERIFGVFQRLHLREEYEGTGAGLAIVKRAAEALGGSVWLESSARRRARRSRAACRSGKAPATSFEPQAKGEREREQVSAGHRSSWPRTTRTTSRSPDAPSSAAARLRAGVARDGEEALKMLGEPQLPPDLVLLDINLPKLTGLQVLEQMRRTSAWSALPVVMLSASDREEDVRRSYELGANSYIQKPVVFEDFVEAVELLTSTGLRWRACRGPLRRPKVMQQ